MGEVEELEKELFNLQESVNLLEIDLKDKKELVKKLERVNYSLVALEAKEVDVFTCERCSHFEICFLRKNVSEFMEIHFPLSKPFEVPELAKICNMYEPLMQVVYEK